MRNIKLFLYYFLITVFAIIPFFDFARASDPTPSPTFPAINSSASLIVYVQNESGLAVVDANVQVNHADVTFTDSLGKAVFFNLSEGDTYIEVSKGAARGSINTHLVQGINTVNIYVGTQNSVYTSSIVGVVTSSVVSGSGANSTIKSIANALITVNQANTTHQTITDSYGKYQLFGLRINEIVSISASAAGYIDQTVTDRTNAHTLTKNFILQPNNENLHPKSSLSGYVIISKSQLVLPGAEITLQQDSLVFKTTASATGSYNFSNLAPGKYTISASTIFASSNNYTVTLQPDSNQYNINLNPKSQNVIKGTARYKNRMYASGPTIKIFEKQTHSLVGETMVYSGEFIYSARNLIKNVTYVIEPWKDKVKLIGATTEIKFSSDLGEVKTVDLTINESPNYKYKLNVKVVDKVTQESIKGAEVKFIDSYDNKVINKATSNKDGMVSFSNISNGFYLISVEITGYQMGTETIYLFDKPDEKGNLVLLALNKYFTNTTDCVKYEQNNVKNFWFCGDGAKNLYLSRPTVWGAIDNQIGKLRSIGSKYAVLPLQIIITSDSYLNAAYHSASMMFTPIKVCQQSLSPISDLGPDYNQEYIYYLQKK
jgi:hypothetical protein